MFGGLSYFPMNFMSCRLANAIPHLITPFFRNAQPDDKLKAAYRKFLAHSMARPTTATDVCGVPIECFFETVIVLK